MARNDSANARKQATKAPAMVATALLATLLLAGCTGPADPTQSIPAEAQVSYDGAQSGSHSDGAGCDAEGTLSGNGEVADGEVTVRVTDGNGAAMIERSFDTDFDLDKVRLDGHSGSWTLHVERDGNDLAGDQFNGAYSFYLDCQPF